MRFDRSPLIELIPSCFAAWYQDRTETKEGVIARKVC